MNTQVAQHKNSPMTTAEGEHFYHWFYDLYEDSFSLLSDASGGMLEKNLRLFDIRLNNSLATKISLDSTFRHAETESMREVSRLTLRLSNKWFCYEALLAACESLDLTKGSKSKIDKIKDEVLSDLDYQYDFFDVMLKFWGMTDDAVHGNSKYRTDLQKYVNHLEAGATSVEQRKFLSHVFNRYTNHEMFSVQESLALVYAIRNQYVHAGESPKSGVEFYATKITILRYAHDFLVLFCLRLGTLLFDKTLASLE
ncbi:hypothetical protein [Burkholderia cenocepacia]|uniref:hypothetical protein n=1 Tax=Burkholderia cenocepacia TaxID=95486 RepID=UPI0022316F31|nr:hypothetical protein [Burkholderia cenocepacia]MCW3656923.1 hypothetical protein [Burkholderia cenocepacia]MDS0804740.1 hypothetical protein [Burkholderia cenocepacia]